MVRFVYFSAYLLTPPVLLRRRTIMKALNQGLLPSHLKRTVHPRQMHIQGSYKDKDKVLQHLTQVVKVCLL